MNIALFLIILFGLQLFCLIVGRRASKNLKDKEDYFLAGKSIRFFPLMMTFLATQVGGGLILGSAEEAYQYGWSVLVYPLGTSLGLIFLGLGLGKRLAQFQVSTVAQIFEVVYRSTLLRRIASLLSVISLFMILVAQIIASHKFLASLGLTSPFLFIALWAILIAYTVRGGLRAVVATDMVQAAFSALIFVLCFSFALVFTPSSSIPFSQLENFTFLPDKLSGWLMMPLLFMIIEQDMGQRCFAGNSGRTVSKATLCAGICTMLICIIPVFFGTLAKTAGLEIPQGTSVLIATIISVTNPWITALVGAAICTAILSTSESLINAISSNLSNDFQLSLFQKKNSIQMVKMLTAMLAVLAIFCSFFFDSVLNLLIQSYALSVSCLFVPIFISLFKKKGNTLSALFSIIFGAAAFISFKAIPLDFPKELASVFLSFGGFYIGELITHYRRRAIQEV